MVSEHSKKSSGNRLTIDEGVPLGEVVHRKDLGVSVTRELDAEKIAQVYEMISRGFIDHNQSSLLKQDMTMDEFEREARDRSVLKYIAMNAESPNIQGYLSVHTQLEDITWADGDLLQRQQMAIGPGEQSFYVGTFVVPKELRGLKVSSLLLEASLSQFVNFNRMNGNRSLCFFDRSDSGAPGMKAYTGRKLKEVEGDNPDFMIKEIDTVYYIGFSRDFTSKETAGETLDKTGHHVIVSEVDGQSTIVVTGECLEDDGSLKKSVYKLLEARLPDFMHKSDERIVLETREEEIALAHDVYDKQHFYQITPPPAAGHHTAA